MKGDYENICIAWSPQNWIVNWPHKKCFVVIIKVH